MSQENHNTQHHPDSIKRPRRGAPGGMVADQIVNAFTLSGAVIAIDIRLSGAMVLTVRVDSRPDKPIAHTNGERKLTSKFLVWASSYLAEQWLSTLTKSLCMVSIQGRMHGIIQVVDGREYLMAEMKAVNIRLITADLGRLAGGGRSHRPYITRQHDYSKDEEGAVADANGDATDPPDPPEPESPYRSANPAVVRNGEDKP